MGPIVDGGDGPVVIVVVVDIGLCKNKRADRAPACSMRGRFTVSGYRLR